MWVPSTHIRDGYRGTAALWEQRQGDHMGLRAGVELEEKAPGSASLPQNTMQRSSCSGLVSESIYCRSWRDCFGIPGPQVKRTLTGCECV